MALTHSAKQTQALVHLQSITIVFLKIILTNVSAVVNQANGPNSMRCVTQSRWFTVENLTDVFSEGFGSANGYGAGHGNIIGELNADAAIDELDNLRLREITGKAISGSLLLLVKWFKRSREFKLIVSSFMRC